MSYILLILFLFKSVFASDYAYPVVINSDKPVLSTYGIWNTASNRTASINNSFPASYADKVWYVPRFFKNAWGSWNTGLQIQNTEVKTANVRLQFVNMANGGAVVKEVSYQIEPMGNLAIYSLHSQFNDVADGTIYALKVISDTEILVDVSYAEKPGEREWSRGSLFQAVPQKHADKIVYMSHISKNYWGNIWGYDIQNVSNSTANVVVTIYSYESGMRVAGCNHSIPSGGTISTYVPSLSCVAGLEANKLYWAKIVSDQDIVSVYGVSNEDSSNPKFYMSFNTKPDKLADSALYSLHTIEQNRSNLNRWVAGVNVANVTNQVAEVSNLMWNRTDGSRVAINPASTGRNECKNTFAIGAGSGTALYYGRDGSDLCVGSEGGVMYSQQFTAASAISPKLVGNIGMSRTTAAGANSDQDFQAYSAFSNSDKSTRWFIPRVYKNYYNEWASAVVVFNPGNEVANVTYYLLGQGGRLHNKVSVAIPPKAARTINTSTDNGANGDVNLLSVVPWTSGAPSATPVGQIDWCSENPGVCGGTIPQREDVSVEIKSMYGCVEGSGSSCTHLVRYGVDNYSVSMRDKDSNIFPVGTEFEALLVDVPGTEDDGKTLSPWGNCDGTKVAVGAGGLATTSVTGGTASCPESAMIGRLVFKLKPKISGRVFNWSNEVKILVSPSNPGRDFENNIVSKLLITDVKISADPNGAGGWTSMARITPEAGYSVKFSPEINANTGNGILGKLLVHRRFSVDAINGANSGKAEVIDWGNGNKVVDGIVKLPGSLTNPVGVFSLAFKLSDYTEWSNEVILARLPAAACSSGAKMCDGNTLKTCVNDAWDTGTACGSGTTCGASGSSFACNTLDQIATGEQCGTTGAFTGIYAGRSCAAGVTCSNGDGGWKCRAPSASLSCSCPAGVPAKSQGNANCDGVINAQDWGIWIDDYYVKPAYLPGAARTNRRTSGESYRSDFNCDGVSTTLDYSLWLNNYTVQ